MRLRRALGMTVTVPTFLTAIVLASTSAEAAGARASWTFDETGSPPAVLTDQSGNGNNGTPEGGVTGDGSAYTFNGTGRVVVDDSASLNPGAADFSFTVRFTTALPATGTDYDVIRKGFAKTTGGEYKMEILNVNGVARALCLVKDSAKHAVSIRGGKKTLADGQVHTVTCSKTSAGVTIAVDALAPKTKVGGYGLGTVTNTAQLSIGSKTAAGGDWFVGSILDASVD